MDRAGKLLKLRYDLLCQAHTMLSASLADPAISVDTLIRQAAAFGRAAIILRRAIGYRKWDAMKEALLGVYIAMFEPQAAYDTFIEKGRQLKSWEQAQIRREKFVDKLAEAGEYLVKGKEARNAGKVLPEIYYKVSARADKERRMK